MTVCVQCTDYGQEYFGNRSVLGARLGVNHTTSLLPRRPTSGCVVTLSPQFAVFYCRQDLAAEGQIVDFSHEFSLPLYCNIC